MGQELRGFVSWRRLEPGVVNAVGVWFYCVSTDRYLYLMRRDHKHPGSWALPGGKIESGESLLMAIQRECREELGLMPTVMNLSPIEQFTGHHGTFTYHTFFACVYDEFVPVLNQEHLGYAWVRSGVFPKPMHPGLWSTVNFEAVRNKVETLRQQFGLDPANCYFNDPGLP